MDTLELIKCARQGDKRAREKVILDNMGLVWSIVRRFQSRNCEMEDLFQIGSIGLMKAVDKFDLEYDVKFSTYAVPMITGEIRRFLRDDGMIRVSRSLKENHYRMNYARELLGKELGREATLEEISKDTGISREDLVMAMEACTQVESLSKPIILGDGNEMTWEERLPDEHNATEKLLEHMWMKELLDQLTTEERDLIGRRYFAGKTQVVVARELGVSQVQVSRLEKKILRKMRIQAES